MFKAALHLFLFLAVTKGEECPGVKTINLPQASAVGRWYLAYATKLGGTSGSQNACGFFNTLPPCKCLGLLVNTTMKSPIITEYTVQNFGYQQDLNLISTTEIDFKTDNPGKLAIFQASVPLANISFPIAIVGTDNYSSWISLAMCNGINDGGKEVTPVWVITRSPVATSSVAKEALAAIQSSTNQDSKNLTQVSQLDCPPLL